MSAEIEMCANLFVYVLNLLWVRYNCAKFHHCSICVRDLRKGVFLLAPHLWAVLKRFILNRSNITSHICFQLAGIKFQPVPPGEISPYMGKSDFIPARQDSFPLAICFHFFHFLLVFFRNRMLNYCFILLRWAEMITWENFVPAKYDSSSTKEVSRLARMKLFTCNRRIKFVKGL